MYAIVPEVGGALLRRVAAGALCFLALGASAQSRPMASLAVTQPPGAVYEPPPPPPQPTAESRLESLGMGDMIRITVFRNPDLTTEARVSERGTILFPMVGEIPVAGLTPSQAGARIAEKLRAGAEREEAKRSRGKASQVRPGDFGHDRFHGISWETFA